MLRPLVPQKAAPQVLLVGPGIDGLRAVEPLSRAGRELEVDGTGNRRRELALQSQDVFEIAVVRFGPHLRLSVDLDQLRVHADAAAGTADGSFDHVTDAE